MSLRLRCSSRATGHATEGIEIRESDYTASPVALGVVRPVIMLPGDWREWPAAKLNAVLAHERSHIRRRDPAVQLLSAIHRALLWHSPLSWFLHRRIVRVAEEASDDAAVAVTGDRASYAEVLLDFMQRGVRDAEWQGVAMARYGRPEERIHRILDGTALSGGVTRWTVAAILAVGSPLAYLAAAAQTTASGPAFEVADIQLNKSGSPQNDVEFLPGGRVSVRNATLRTLIIVAYNVRGNAVKGGPAWLDSDRFDIVAKANPKSSERDLRLMMQTLLAERFKLRVHPDQKVLPVYALMAGKQGPKLTPDKAPEPGQERCGPVANLDGNHHVVCDHMTMEEFAVALPPMALGYIDRRWWIGPVLRAYTSSSWIGWGLSRSRPGKAALHCLKQWSVSLGLKW
jgi:hypothetical protein